MHVVPGCDRVSADRTQAAPRVAGVAFGGALLYGAILAASFASDHPNVSSLMFRAILVIDLLLPIYRAEYVLGFVLGLTITFGAALPTFIATVMATISAVLHLTVRRGFTWLRERTAHHFLADKAGPR